MAYEEVKLHDHFISAPCAGYNKRPLKYVVLSHNIMPQMSQVLRERAIGMLTSGLSTRAVAREQNVHVSIISRLQRRFREFGSTYNRPHKRTPHVTPPAQTLHIRLLHLRDCLSPASWTADETVALHKRIISAQTVKNHPSEAHLHAHPHHRGIDLTAVWGHT